MQFSVGKKSRNVQDKKMYLIRCRDISIIVRNGILSTWSSSGQSRVLVTLRWLISHAIYDLYETLPPSIGMSAGILTCPKEIFLVLKTQHFESLSYGKEHTKRLHFLCNTLAFIWWRMENFIPTALDWLLYLFCLWRLLATTPHIFRCFPFWFYFFSAFGSLYAGTTLAGEPSRESAVWVKYELIAR